MQLGIVQGSIVAGLCMVSYVPAQEPLRELAAKGLRRAVEFFRKEVAVQGGYLWRYSADLARREGESKATVTQAWVQPPGTPSVGLALLQAYRATGDAYYFDAAHETAMALVRGQLQSGGWDYKIEFDSKLRKPYAYRVDGVKQGKNVSTLDDNTTQAALRFLMAADKKDTPVHDALMYGLGSLLKAQYPNGAWPQRFDGPPQADKFPVKKDRPTASDALVAQVKTVLAALDDKGRWVETGKLRYQGGTDEKTEPIIECQTFIRNVGVLSTYLAATKKD